MRNRSSHRQSSVLRSLHNNSASFSSRSAALRRTSRGRSVALLALISLMAVVSYTTTSASSIGRILGGHVPGAAATAKPVTLRSAAPATKKQLNASAKQKQDEQRTTSELNIARNGHTATTLSDGRILIVGGENSTGPVEESEVYDPITRKFSLSAKLRSSRSDHTATPIPGGHILVVGGHDREGSLRSSEIFDPAANAFSRGPSLSRARSGHTATVLAEGRILIAGGDSGGTAEIIDPTTMKRTRLESRMATPRSSHSAILLKSGKVLIVGGLSPNGGELSSGELFDPETLQFSVVSRSMSGARTRPALRELPDGKVQVIGGDAEQTMEMFNAEGRYFTARARLVPESDSETSITEVLRAPSRAALIQNQDSLAGKKEGVALDPKRRQSTLLESLLGRNETLTDLLDRSGHTMTEMPLTGTALITGGKSSSGMTLMSATETLSSSATVTTDKTDYAPGETVIISGTDWLAGETVELRLHRDEQDPSADTLLSAVADANGDIQNSEYVCQESDLGVTFLLTATGQTSGFVAQTTFMDGVLSVSVSSPTTAGPLTITSLPASVTISFNYRTNGAGGTINGVASVKSGSTVLASNTKGLDRANGGGGNDESIIVTIPTGTADGSYAVEVTVSNPGGTGNPESTTDTEADAITISTTTAPTVTCPDPVTTGSDQGQCSASVSFSTTATGTPTPTVECKIGSLLIASPNVFPVGTTTVTCTASNSAGSASCSFTVTVNDSQNPIISCPSAITQNNDPGQCSAVVNYPNATATDNCPGVGTPSCSPPSGSTFDVGATTVNCTVTDAHDNSNSCSFNVTVDDTENPVITCPNPVTQNNNTGLCSGVVTYPNATATDNCPGVGTPSCAPPSGSTFGVGATTVNCTVTDAHGNSNSCSFTVTVNDTENPSITCPSAVSQNNVPGLCSAVVTYPNATATDNCPGVGTPSCAPPSGSTFAVGVTTVNCNVADAHGNSNSCSFTVTVKDVEAPICHLPNDIVTTCSTASGGGVVTYTATASDNCGAASISCTPASGSTFPIGVTTVNCTASDASPYSSDTLCSFTVTVQYTFTGFFQPVENSPGTNIVKAGQSVPLKFQLTCDGNFISDLSAVTSLQSVNVICDGEVSGDPLPADDSGSSGLHYDYVANQFVYSWKTQKQWANTCRRFILTLNDGSTHEAYFQFKK